MKRKFTLWTWKWIVLLVLVATGCAQLPTLSLPQAETPTPQATATNPPATAVQSLPPVVTKYSPAYGQEVPPDAATITLHFDQPMDRQSVAQALQVLPTSCGESKCQPVEGELSWPDERTAVYTPKVLSAATRYQVSLDAKARSKEGQALAHELAFAFSTLSPLEVTRVSPENGTSDLRGDVPILVAFNRAVVPINCTGQEADEGVCAPLPLKFDPQVLGKGTWLNTSLYKFVPLTGWGAGKTYTVRLDAGIKSVAGAELAEAYTWSFSTALPRLLSTSPADGDTNVPLDTAVRVSFNTPMDTESTTGAFRLTTEDGSVVAGVVAWEDNGAQLVFTPTQSLELGTHYLVQVGQRARAVTSVPLQNPTSWSFTTVPYPALVGFEPQDGDKGVDLQAPVHVNFVGDLDPQTLDKNINVTQADGSAVEDVYTYYDSHSGTETLSWSKLPRMHYCITVQPAIKDRYGNSLREGGSACFTTGDYPPFIGPATTQDALTLDAAVPARYYFLVRNLDKASFTLSSMGLSDFLNDREENAEKIRSWTERFNIPRNEATVEAISLQRRGGPLPTGLYLLNWESASENSWQSSSVLAVVDRHVTLKLAPAEALVWVTDLRSAAPITRTEVRLVDSEGVLIAAGSTDDEGLARIPITPRENLWSQVAAIVGQPGEAGFGLAVTQWNGGVSPWDFDITPDRGPFVPYNLALRTDRPIYRPGQTVYFRGIMRHDQDAHYTLPDLTIPVKVAITDASWQTIYTATLNLSELGTFDSSFALPASAPLGEYQLTAAPVGVDNAPWSVTFEVAAYRKPEFEVSVTPEQADLLNGGTARALVAASYYFGGPVSQAKVHWTIDATPYSFSPPMDGWWHWSSPGEYGFFPAQTIAQGDATTDANGQFLLSVPAKLQPLGKTDKIVSQRWTVHVTLTDDSGFSVDADGSLNVHTARFYIGLHPQQWVVRAGQSVKVDVQTLDWDAEPVGGQDIALTLARREWYAIPAKEPFSGPTWGYTDTIDAKVNVTTDAQGAAVATMTPSQGGSYVIIATAKDADGNSVRTEAFLWVSGQQLARWKMAEGKITPVADAESYEVGDTAHIFLPTPFDGPYRVLMTVERGAILQVEQRVYTETNPIIPLKITGQDVPNVYVSFVVIRGVDETHPVPDVRMGYVALRVKPTAQTLRVTLEPNQTTAYAPGDPLTLTVRTVDAAGKPVDAEVGLALVDKSVLSLRESQTPSLLETFYGERPLAVVTGDSLLVLFNRTTQQLDEMTKEAPRMIAEMAMGGLGGGGGGPETVPVRTKFPDTALWEAHLRTGLSGEAQVNLKLPDSLTTWVAQARAVTEDTEVGEAEAEMQVTKPLLIRPVTPRFFVAGDQPEVAAVVHNNSGSDLDVTVTLSATGVAVQGDPAQQVTVPNGGHARLAWTVVVSPPVGIDHVRMTFIAQSDDYQDAARPALATDAGLPVYRYETPDVVGTGGVLEDQGSRLEVIYVPPNAGKDSALTVNLVPSLAAALLDGLHVLERYPYESTDALVNRFLPNIVTYQALTKLNVQTEEAAKLKEQLQTQVPETLDRLYKQQNDDGGWGWWWREDSTLQITAYVALGMLRAQEAGFEVRADVLHNALAYIGQTLAQHMEGNTRLSSDAFALYVLTLGQQTWPAGVGAKLYASREKLGTTGRAYLAMAFGLADASDTRITTLLEILRGEAAISATGAHWRDVNVRCWGSDTRATAVMLSALLKYAPDDPLIPQAVRWLMVARRGDGWRTTQETVWTISALTDFMVQTKELQADYTWGVALNGQPWDQGQANAETLRRTTTLQAGIEGQAPTLRIDQPNALEVSRDSGTGNLYYTAHLGLSLPADTVQMESRGLTVQREYCRVRDSVSVTKTTACKPLTAPPRPGEMIEVRLTLIVPTQRYFVQLKDPYPAGFEPVKPHETPRLYEPISPQARIAWWWDPFSRRELRDEQAVFFADSLGPGTYRLTYRLRAAIPGTYLVMPATVSELYFPEVWGRSDGAKIQVASAQ